MVRELDRTKFEGWCDDIVSPENDHRSFPLRESYSISQLSSPAIAVFACGVENGPLERSVLQSQEPGNMLSPSKRNSAGVIQTGS